MSDDAKKTILARRARFVAAALAGAALGGACAKDRGVEPAQCLSPPQDYQDDGGPPPEPCLSPPPQVCLEPPPPQVCLSPVPPPPDDTSGGDYAKPPPGKS